MLLALAGGLALIVGGYLVVTTRRSRPGAGTGTGAGESGTVTPEAYLPHASIWPFSMGIGAVVMANGLALGLWAIVPGTIIVVGSVLGYARQSRRRD